MVNYNQTETNFLIQFVSNLKYFDKMLQKMIELKQDQTKTYLTYDEFYHKVFKLNGSIRENFIFYKSGLENVYNNDDYKRLYECYLSLFDKFSEI